MPINTSPSAGFLQQGRPMGMMNKQPGMRAGFRPPTFGMGRTRPRTGGIDPVPPGLGGGPTDRITPMPGRIPGYTPPPQGMVKQPFPGINTSPGGPTAGLPPGMNSTMPIDPNMSPIRKQPFPIDTGPQLKPGAGGSPAPWMPPIRDDFGPGNNGMGPGVYSPPSFGGMEMDRSGVMPQMSSTALPSGMGMGVPPINGQDPLRRYF